MKKIFFYGSLVLLALASYWASAQAVATYRQEFRLESLITSDLDLQGRQIGDNLVIYGDLRYRHKTDPRTLQWQLTILEGKKIVFTDDYETITIPMNVMTSSKFIESLKMPKGRYTVVLGLYYAGGSLSGRPAIIRNVNVDIR